MAVERKKYLVRLIRPVFQTAVVEIDAASDNEALGRAKIDGYLVPEDEWKGRFDPECYFFDAHCVWTDKSEEGHPYTSLDNFPYYILLHADVDAGAGKVLYQPWMNMVQGLLLADLCSDWFEELREARNDGFEEAFEPIQEMIDALQGSPGQVRSTIAPQHYPKIIEGLNTFLKLLEELKAAE